MLSVLPVARVHRLLSAHRRGGCRCRCNAGACERCDICAVSLSLIASGPPRTCIHISTRLACLPLDFARLSTTLRPPTSSPRCSRQPVVVERGSVGKCDFSTSTGEIGGFADDLGSFEAPFVDGERRALTYWELRRGFGATRLRHRGEMIARDNCVEFVTKVSVGNGASGIREQQCHLEN